MVVILLKLTLRVIVRFDPKSILIVSECAEPAHCCPLDLVSGCTHVVLLGRRIQSCSNINATLTPAQLNRVGAGAHWVFAALPLIIILNLVRRILPC